MIRYLFCVLILFIISTSCASNSCTETKYSIIGMTRYENTKGDIRYMNDDLECLEFKSEFTNKRGMICRFLGD